MPDEKVIIELMQTVNNTRGEPVKDMLDPPRDMKQSDAPDLTLGSLLANAMYLGITGANRKDALKYYQAAGKIEEAMKPVNEGKWSLNRGELDQLGEAWDKVNVPVFTLAIYAGFVQEIINNAKVELLALEKAAKEAEKSKTTTK